MNHEEFKGIDFRPRMPIDWPAGEAPTPSSDGKVNDVVNKIMDEILDMPLDMQNKVFFHFRESLMENRHKRLQMCRKEYKSAAKEIETIEKYMQELGQ